MSKEINLQNILDEIHDSKYRASYKTWYSQQCILEAMKEACRQTLELASKNARCDSSYGVDISHTINRQSILNTINQIKYL